jgi:hypothetical protein
VYRGDITLALLSDYRAITAITGANILFKLSSFPQ